MVLLEFVQKYAVCGSESVPASNLLIVAAATNEDIVIPDVILRLGHTRASILPTNSTRWTDRTGSDK